MGFLKVLHTPWWRSIGFISAIFGSLMSTIFVFTMFFFGDKLEYTDLVDFFNQLLPSILPIWSILFVATLILNSLTINKINDIYAYMGFSEKSYVGLCTLLYFFIGVASVLIAIFFSFGLFNSIVCIFSIVVGLIFSTSMRYSLNKVNTMEGDL